MTAEYQCVWPCCREEGFVSSGNVGGAIVCRNHFKITNGKNGGQITEYERGVIHALADLFGRSYHYRGIPNGNVVAPTMKVESK